MKASGMDEAARRRHEMVERQLAARGISDEAVLEAMREVPRDAFVAPDLVEFAYEDAPLPIEEQQTISQPYIVALMAEALGVKPGTRMLDVGTGSGYAAAVLSRVAGEVYTIERHASLVRSAQERFGQLGYDNVYVRHGDGTLGWAEHAPYDAIMVAAGGPEIPKPLLDQLAIGGSLVVPAGPSLRSQRLLRVRRTSEETYEQEDLGRVQFVPLIGQAGWGKPEDAGSVERTAGTAAASAAALPGTSAPESLPERLRWACEWFPSIEGAHLGGLLDRIGKARLVLLGEASHGTAEFYDMRARITRALIEQKGFRIVAVEADWPDAARIDRYVRHTTEGTPEGKPFDRFPVWMWANTSVLRFIEWLRDYNGAVDGDNRAGFYGLDLYSLYGSIEAVLNYLDDVDPEAAGVARQRYGCLTPYEQNPATYGAAAISGRYRECESEVVAMLDDLLARQMRYTSMDGQRFFDAAQNARLVASAERYYRAMYYGARVSWNLRDRHMFDTLQMLLDHRGAGSKAVVWAHNSHLGDASATEMGARGEHNVGQLCREAYGDEAYLIGFGTDHGTVAAASKWGGAMEVKQVQPSHPDSYERLFHKAHMDRCLLPLRHAPEVLREALREPRLERAIGVIYRPETELESHYFYASLPRQFDEYVWFEETRAVTPLGPEHAEGVPETFPFGL